MDLACFDQLVPCAWAHARQVQALLAAQPDQSRTELIFASLADLQAAQGVVVLVDRDAQPDSLLTARHHAIKPGDGHSGEADRHLITRTNIEFSPALQRPDADAADGSVIEPYRFQIQNRLDLSGSAHREVDLAHLPQHL